MVQPPLIRPIDEHQRTRVRAATTSYVARANALLNMRCQEIAIRFDLIGRAAGMYQVRRGTPAIRYNPYLFAKYFEENLNTTIPHEVAHYVVDELYGCANVKPHGAEWRELMNLLGADDRVHCDFDLSGIPRRRYRRINYVCRCRQHQLTRIRHNRIQQHGTRYYCRNCHSELMPAQDRQ